MPVLMSYRISILLKELIKLNEDEPLSTELYSKQVKSKIIFCFGLTSPASVYPYLYYLLESGIMQELSSSLYLFHKNKAIEFIEDNNPNNKKRKLKDKKLVEK